MNMIEYKTPFDYLAEWEDKFTMAFALATLEERDCDILLLRFVDCWTLQKIADKYDLSRCRISEIIQRALVKMRHPSRQYIFNEHGSDWPKFCEK